MLRSYLVELLESDRRFTVTARARLDELINVELDAFDVCVLDTAYDVPHCRIKEFTKSSPDLAVVVFSWNNDARWIRETLQSGVKRYLVKGEASAEDLISALIAAAPSSLLH